jgi:3-deoxy-D-manno-octulosonic-acid transferase
MRYPRLRLVLVPRHPERFDEVASLIEEHRFPVVRRSQNVPPPTSPPIPPVILGDTMGELRRFYAAAEIVFVGRSLVDLGARQHGSDMIEPAAQARPVVIGPYTGNFAEAVRRFLAANAMVVADDPSALAAAVERLLEHPDEAMAMGRRAMQVVASEQGATSRNADLILALLRRSLDRDSSRSSSPAAALATEQAPTR